MIIGVPKEIKTNENRIALLPGGAESLVSHGHTVLVEQGGGLGSGFSDDLYVKAGAKIVPTADTAATNPFALSDSLVAWLTLAFLWIGAGYFLVRMPDLRGTLGGDQRRLQR